MIKLLNKILNRFGFELVNKKPDMTLVEASVKFLNENPKFVSDSEYDSSTVGYVGDINYVKERVKGEFPQVSGKTYYQHQNSVKIVSIIVKIGCLIYLEWDTGTILVNHQILHKIL